MPHPPALGWLCRALCLGVAALALAACSLNVAPDGGVFGADPLVTLVAPLDGAAYLDGVPINLLATVSNARGLASVSFMVNGAPLATLDAPNPDDEPVLGVQHTWQPGAPGSYIVSVVAANSAGASSAPASVTVRVVGEDEAGQVVVAPAADAATATNSAAPRATVTRTTITARPANPTPLAGAAPATSAPVATATSAPQAQAQPTSARPVFRLTTGANIRRGPSTAFDPPLGTLTGNVTVDIIAINTGNERWYKIRTASGAEGWVFSGLGTAEGNLSSLPTDPGPPFPTAVPAPVVPPTVAPPQTLDINVAFSGEPRIDPFPLVCGVTSGFTVTITNTGTQPFGRTAAVVLRDLHVASGTVTQETIGPIPDLQPGQSFDVQMALTVDTYYEEEHRLVIVLDANNELPETNEGDNRFERAYTLARGGC